MSQAHMRVLAEMELGRDRRRAGLCALAGLACLAMAILVLVPASAPAQKNEAAAQVADSDAPSTVNDPATLKAGKKVFAVHCSRCHGLTALGSLGTSGAGPNLRDAEWLHGSSYQDILRIVNEGVSGKTMNSWKRTLGTERVEQVVAYVYSIRFTD
ncbi:MAG: c-type cytochrome [SAR324 cluster bacterium]|nr:c-type cytochrome [SAR324 cluster bacterium]